MVGVNTDSDPAAFRAHCEEFGVTWDNVFNGGTASGVPLQWGISGYPTIFVIDAEGRIAARDLRGEELSAFVADLLARTPRR